ncbi:MAG: cytochrome d ubiquinol oxidase subunit II, partial [Candidatus Hydrogenedentes bacterium]|nr:cytochrome d ubiquinol oxidase subunit II [Candidatus Hydrogenedentota bacterium]
TFFNLLGPYQITVGLFVGALFAMHGNMYLCLKTDGELETKMRGWAWKTFFFFLIMYAVVTVYTVFGVEHALTNFAKHPAAWAVVGLNALAIANIPRALWKNQFLGAFLSSSAAIAALTLLLGITLWPNLVVSNIDPAYTLNIYNASSSPKALKIMLIIAILGMPFVLAYTSVIYWVFRGKVEVGKLTY